MQAFADDVEGRQPNVLFNAPPPLDQSSSSPSPSPSSQDTLNGAAQSSSSTSTSPPFLEPEPLQTPPPPGIAGTVVSAIGGAIGWVEKLLGRGR